MGSRIRAISVVVPMRNEAGHVRDLVEDLAAQDFEGDVRLLVADGASTDGSRELLERAAEQRGLVVTVLDNPEGTVSAGLNRCIARSDGDLVVRLDAHSRYPADYLRRCAEASEQTGAENVGGIYVAEGRTPYERAVAAALGSPFGGVNWTRARQADGRVEADTVYCGAFRPRAFELAGTFDESFVRNQDDELNLRLRRAGGRVVLDPAIRARYRPRSSLRAVARQYYEYGYWKVAVLRKHRRVGSLRSLVPVAFVLTLVLLVPASMVSRHARRLLGVEVASYGAAAGVFAVRALRAGHEPLGRLPSVLATFAAFHLGHGAGMLVGALQALVNGGPARGRRSTGRARRPGAEAGLSRPSHERG